MQQSASITIIPADQLESMPQAVQEYVGEFFAEEDIFGRKCYVAFGALSRPSWDNTNGRKGSSPSHHGDQMRFTEGLGGMDLSEWMQQAAKEGAVWSFRTSWYDGTQYPMTD